ncbi:hypothetical protein KIN20_036229 [Parelaphostrongylus tenuis]|uniref:Secreted protein n=1 Tax=Parelaphostrongylus tenuis TaxID=148309 RepID=A0AAD5RCJ3_PARTN|nr:hypothetical protein KIN20_036229 [Parelaphostrongylus tenuis]
MFVELYSVAALLELLLFLINSSSRLFRVGGRFSRVVWHHFANTHPMFTWLRCNCDKLVHCMSFGTAAPPAPKYFKWLSLMETEKNEAKSNRIDFSSCYAKLLFIYD